MKANIKQNKCLKALSLTLFLLYMGMLLKILIFRDSNPTGSGLHQVNLVPFKTIAEYAVMAVQNGRTGIKQFLLNIPGNVAILVPFGIFLPILFKKMNRWQRVMLSASCFSIFIEILQYILNVGSSDIDDVILNTLGSVAGCFVFRWLTHNRPLKCSGYSALIGLSTLMMSGGVFVAFREYSVLLGI